MSAAPIPERLTETSSPTVALLTRVTVAFSRRRGYPESHPLVRSAESQAFESLSQVLAERPVISLSVGADELLVDGAPVAHAGNVAHDLAERLRRRGIGAISFDRTVTPTSLSDAFRFLATEPETADDGSVIALKPPALAGVTIARIAYGRLALGNDASNPHTKASDIWRLLASAALLDDEKDLDGGGTAVDPRNLNDSGAGSSSRARGAQHPSRPDHAPRNAHNAATNGGTPAAHTAFDAAAEDAGSSTVAEPVVETGAREKSADVSELGDAGSEPNDMLADAEPEVVAQAIERRLPRAGYAKQVAFVLLRVADQVAHAPPQMRAQLGERLRNVLTSLQTSSLSNIIRSVGVGAEQRRFMAQMLDALPPDATIEWLERAAGATDQSLSPHLLRLLSKLSDRVENSSARAAGETAFRSAAQDLVNGWTLNDPNPNAHALLLDQIWRYESPETAAALPDPGQARLVQIALEIDEVFDDANDAAQDLLAAGRVPELLQWVEEAPGRRAAAALEELIVSPSAIRSVLLREPLDLPVARTLLTSLDQRATEVLLDVLRDAEGRAIRRLVYDHLREFGPKIMPQLIARLDGAPWYFVRNLLALLRDTAATGEASHSPAASLRSFLDHPQEQVRLEALRLLVADNAARDSALRHALDDRSERVVSTAIELLASDLPPAQRPVLSAELGRRLLRFVEAGAHPESLQVRAVRALADVTPGTSIRDVLLGLVSRRTWLVRRLALNEPKPIMLAALEVLAARYASDPASGVVLDLAVADSDPRVRAAARDPKSLLRNGGAS